MLRERRLITCGVWGAQSQRGRSCRHDNDTDDLVETIAEMPKPVVEEEPAEDAEE